MLGKPLDETMILLKDIVQILNLQDFNRLTCTSDFQDVVYSLNSSQIGSAFINDYFVWNTIVYDGLLEETPCGTEISALREHEIKGLTVTINRPIEISPFAFDLDICLVNTQELAVGFLRFCA